MLDFPGRLSGIFWFKNCNMRCLYCYNHDIINSPGHISYDDAMEFLEERAGLLDGIVLSGGEATMHAELPHYCQALKSRNFEVKLDTNGSNPKRVKELLSMRLLDYVALDFKAPKNKFEEITKSDFYEAFLETLGYIQVSGIEFEVRTTVHPDLLSVEDLNTMMQLLKDQGYNQKYYLQKFFSEAITLAKLSKIGKYEFESLSDILPVHIRST